MKREAAERNTEAELQMDLRLVSHSSSARDVHMVDGCQ